MDKEKELEELDKLEKELNIENEQSELTDELIESAAVDTEGQDIDAVEDIPVEEEFPGIEFIQQDDKKSRRKYVLYQVMRAIVVMIALFAFGYASYELTLVYLENDSTYATKDEISNMFLQDVDNLPGGNVVYTSEGETIIMENGSDGKAFVWDYQKMLEYNNSAVGYIRQDDGSYIDYPILHADDNEYYLYHLPDHTWSSMGSIFLDYRVEEGLNADYSIVYGHYIGKRANNIMFGSLNWYWDWPNYHKEHPTFDIYVQERHYKYYVFSIMKVPATGSEVYNLYFASDEERFEFFKSVEAQSKYEFVQAPELTMDSKVIMLSTCTTDKEVRFVMFLVRGEEIYDVPGVDYENDSSSLETTKKDDSSTTPKETTTEKETTKKNQSTSKEEEETAASDATTSEQKSTQESATTTQGGTTKATQGGTTKATQGGTATTSSEATTNKENPSSEEATSSTVEQPSESDSNTESTSGSTGETDSTEETGASDESSSAEGSSEEETTPME